MSKIAVGGGEVFFQRKNATEKPSVADCVQNELLAVICCLRKLPQLACRRSSRKRRTLCAQL